MRGLRYSYYVIVLMLTLCLVLPLLAEEKTEEIYTIKPGDTLWEISSKFLKDPFLWPKLWQRNPYITNPHWIYPGRPIRLTSVDEVRREEPKAVAGERPSTLVREEAVKKVEPPPIEKKVEVVAEAKAEAKPEARPGLETPPVYPEVRSAGFFSDLDYRGIGVILESKEGKSVMANGDVLYVAFKKTSEPILVGNRYTAFRQAELGYPEMEKKVGYRYDITGNIQIIDQYGNFYTARVLEAFQEIYKGDMLQPYLKEKMEIGGGRR